MSARSGAPSACFTLLLAAALVLPVCAAGAAPARTSGYRAVGAWALQSAAGFGTGAANMAAMPFAEFGGELYCGVASRSGAQVRKLAGSSWNLVNTPGFGNAGNIAVTSLETFGGQLYAGTANMDGCEVWRYNGAVWTPVAGGGASTGPGFGSPGNVVAMCMETHGGNLYVGTANINYSVIPINIWSAGGEAWSFDGAAWTRDAAAGFGDAQNAAVVTMKEYAGALYAGTARVSLSVAVPGTIDVTVEGTGCELRKRNGVGSWGLIGERGFGAAGNAALTAMEEFGGGLLLGTANGGATISLSYDLITGAINIVDLSWHSDGCGVYSFDGSLVTELVSGGFGDTGNVAAFATTTVSASGTDVLLMGVLGMTGTGMEDFYTTASLRAYNGTDWYHGAPDGFGSDRNKAVSALYTRSGQVYAGTLNPEDGCEIWLGTPPAEPVPYISSIGTGKGKPGSQVIIEGEYFDTSQGASKVVFADGAEAQVLSWSDKSITCLVPEGAVSGGVVVRTGRGESNAYPFEVEGYVWYLAEGCTDGGFETWVLVQNPGTAPVDVSLTLMTGTGPVSPPELQGVGIAAGSRQTFPIHNFVTTYDVSTMVISGGGPVICERAMYGGGRTWGHDSVGVTSAGSKWYLAEGCTDGGFETWVLVQNPGLAPVAVDLTYMTEAGPVDGPQGYPIAPGSRHTFLVNETVTTYHVSTMVESAGGPVICERAMYGGGRTWGHDSVGVTSAGSKWYLAEGCTDGGFETWVLVQNPGLAPVTVDLTYMTEAGPVDGPQGYPIAPGSRHTFLVNETVTTYHVSTMVESAGGPVICERAMYGGGRTWGHDSVGVTSAGSKWYLAEGCTDGGFETWVLVQNPGSSQVSVSLTLMTGDGPMSPPELQGVPIAANSRRTFPIHDYVTTYHVSTMVESAGGPVICERAMYGGGRTWGHDSIGYDP